MTEHEKINSPEFSAKDLEATKSFFSRIFNWSFEDFGSGYIAFISAIPMAMNMLSGQFWKHGNINQPTALIL